MTLWSNNNCLKLIEKFKSHPVLWNPEHANYKEQSSRLAALRNLQTHFNVEESELKRKLKNLTSHYHRERNKTLTCRKYGRVYRSKWFAYEALDFLRNKNTVRKNRRPCVLYTNVNNISPSKSDREELGGEEEVACSFAEVKAEIEEHDPLEDKNKSLDDVPGMIRSIYDKISSRDEFTLLGDEVATKVRNLNTDYAKCVVKHKIQTVLFEAGIGMYDSPKTEANTQNKN